jgi:hypothetical protein
MRVSSPILRLNAISLMQIVFGLNLKRSEKDSPVLRIYDARGSSQPLHKIERLHYQPVHLIRVKHYLKLKNEFEFNLKTNSIKVQSFIRNSRLGR